jgi:hypothetical protein
MKESRTNSTVTTKDEAESKEELEQIWEVGRSVTADTEKWTESELPQVRIKSLYSELEMALRNDGIPHVHLYYSKCSRDFFRLSPWQQLHNAGTPHTTAWMASRKLHRYQC